VDLAVIIVSSYLSISLTLDAIIASIDLKLEKLAEKGGKMLFFRDLLRVVVSGIRL
jgi:hypothetical protein